jgi:hypothetical protein
MLDATIINEIKEAQNSIRAEPNPKIRIDIFNQFVTRYQQWKEASYPGSFSFAETGPGFLLKFFGEEASPDTCRISKFYLSAQTGLSLYQISKRRAPSHVMIVYDFYRAICDGIDIPIFKN